MHHMVTATLVQFVDTVKAFLHLPELDRKQALIIGEHLSDADRGAFLEQLQGINAQLQDIHQGEQKALEQTEDLILDVEKALNRFERREAEQAERGSSLGSIDQQLSDHS
jgi:hypothetical protein